MKKRTIIKFLAGVLFIFSLVNIAWYLIRAAKYDGYSIGMDEADLSTFVVPQYTDTDAENFTYSVFYPGYLHFTGNLFVGFPPVDERNPYTNSLLIWPLITGGYEYGVLLYGDDVQYQIYVDQNGNAIYEEDRPMVSKYAQQISTLLEKANAKWILK